MITPETLDEGLRLPAAWFRNQLDFEKPVAIEVECWR